MEIVESMEVLITQPYSCHNGEIGIVYTPTPSGALVRVRDCEHHFSALNLRAVPPPHTIPSAGGPNERGPVPAPWRTHVRPLFAALILTVLCSGGGLAAGYLWAAIR